jgi:restriction system protein
VLSGLTQGVQIGSRQYSHERGGAQEALRLERQRSAAEKVAERERKVQETADGKAKAERLNTDLVAQIARLASILSRGLEREAALDLNALARQNEFPPLDLGLCGVAPPRPSWSDYAPPEPGGIAALFGGKSRHQRSLAAAHEAFEQAELNYDRAEAERQQWMREQALRHEADHRAHQDEVARHNNQVAQFAAGLSPRHGSRADARSKP